MFLLNIRNSIDTAPAISSPNHHPDPGQQLFSWPLFIIEVVVVYASLWNKIVLTDPVEDLHHQRIALFIGTLEEC